MFDQFELAIDLKSLLRFFLSFAASSMLPWRDNFSATLGRKDFNDKCLQVAFAGGRVI